MAVGDILRLTVIATPTGEAQELVNTFHFRQDLPTVFDTPAEDLVQAWIADAETGYRGLFTAAFGIDLYRVAVMPVAGAIYEESRPHVLGTLTGETLPYQNSALISWRTGVPGRSNRGRTYLFPGDEATVQSGFFTSGFRDTLIAWGESVLEIGDGTTTSTYTLMVYSTLLGTSRPVTSVQVGNRPRTQRNRAA